jgi:EmrB/QacA subfamily drug resistance transporter
MALERKWWTLIVVCTAIFMLLLDITVVNVALPAIQRSLHSSFSDLQWVVDAYSLTLAALLLTAGVIGDIFGRRLIFAIGLAIFSISSLLCGVAVNSLMLNLARGAQGVGGAVMFATSLALIAQAFQGRERATAFGIYGAVIGGAVAIGPLIGGGITSSIGWRWIFILNVPIGIVAIFLSLIKIERSGGGVRRRIDWVGLVSFTVALFFLVFALVRGDGDGWTSAKVLTLLIVAGVLLAVFVVAELTAKDPMLDLTLFRKPAMVGISIGAFCMAASFFALFLYLTLYIQDDLGYGPLQAGLRFLPVTLLSFFVAPLAARVSTKLPARLLLFAGLAFVGVGSLVMSHTTPTSGWALLLPGFILAGIGIGVFNPVMSSAAVGIVTPERSGMASGANNTFRQVGVATGIAGLGAVFSHQMAISVGAALAKSAAGRAAYSAHPLSLKLAVQSGNVRTVADRLPLAQQHAVISSYATGFSSSLNHLLLIATITAGVGAVSALALVRQKDFAVGHTNPGGSVSA